MIHALSIWLLLNAAYVLMAIRSGRIRQIAAIPFPQRENVIEMRRYR